MILYQSPVSFHPKEMERNGCVVWYNTGNSHFEFRARFPFSIFDDREKKSTVLARNALRDRRLNTIVQFFPVIKMIENETSHYCIGTKDTA